MQGGCDLPALFFFHGKTYAEKVAFASTHRKKRNISQSAMVQFFNMMDTLSVKGILEKVYKDINGWVISHKARQTMPYFSASFIYDEANVDSFAAAFEKVQPQNTDVFYDLGSGLGKKVFAAAMLSDVSESIGIEILPDMYTTSCEIYEALLESGNIEQKRVHFLLGDYLEADFSSASIIHISISPFMLDCQLYGSLGQQLRKLKVGTRIITSEVPLSLPEYTLTDTIDYAFPTRVEKAFIHWKNR